MLTSKTPFNPSVHGARGLFASMVFLFHIINSGLPTYIPGESFLAVYVFNSCKFGVELFFGISGYVILGALSRAPSIRSFLWDRATRIFPLLWLTLIGISAVSVAVGHWLPPVADWLVNFLAPPPFFPLPQVNPAAWSLGYEITFYALCALSWLLRARGFRGWWAFAVVSGTLLLILFPRAVLMPAGVLIAAGSLRRPAILRLAAFPALGLLLFLLGWRMLDLQAGGDIATLTPIDLPAATWLTLLPALIGSGALGGLALLGIVEQRGILTRLLRTRPLQWLGTISFSFYLWQPAVMGPAKQLLIRSGAVFAAGPASQLMFALVSLPLTLIVAHYSHKWVELRLTRALRRLGPREGDGQPPSTALTHKRIMRVPNPPSRRPL